MGTLVRAGYGRISRRHSDRSPDEIGTQRRNLRSSGKDHTIAAYKEWQDEIEKALFAMDALAVILTPKFNGSKWTDQEVGVAVGRAVLIIPIGKGNDHNVP